MLKHLGLISVLCMWLGTYILLQRHSPDLGKSISKHAAKTTRYHILYGVVELIVVGLFALFIFGWFIPAFKLGMAYAVAGIIGIAGTVVAAFIPDREGWRNKVHAAGAYSMAVALMAMNLILLFTGELSLVARTVLVVATIYMVVGWGGAIFYNKFFRDNMLKLQVFYFLAFQIPILLAVYF